MIEPRAVALRAGAALAGLLSLALLISLTAYSPPIAAGAALATIALTIAWLGRASMVRALPYAGGAVALCTAVVGLALWPATMVLLAVAGGVVLLSVRSPVAPFRDPAAPGAGMIEPRAVALRAGAALAGLLSLALLISLTAYSPPIAAGAALATIALTIAWLGRASMVRALPYAGGAVALCTAVVGLALWPATMVLLAVAGGVVLLSVRSPVAPFRDPAAPGAGMIEPRAVALRAGAALAGLLSLALLISLTAYSPPIAAGAALATIALTIAWLGRASMVRALPYAGGAVALCTAVVGLALWPATMVLLAVAGGVVLLSVRSPVAPFRDPAAPGAGMIEPRAVALRAGAALAGLLSLALLISLTAYSPPIAAGAALATIALTIAWLGRASMVRALPYAGGAVALCTAVVGLALWPATMVLLAVAGGVVLLSVRSPVAGLVAAVVLFETEGSWKVVLTKLDAPLGLGSTPVVALILDLALLAAVAILVIGDRWRTPIELWRRAGLLDRAAIAALIGWLAVSAVQAFQADPVKGMQGFRLTQAYVLMAVAGAIAYRRDPRSLLQGLLWATGALAAYAALRTATGPLDVEAGYAISRDPAATYGDTFRTIGSLTSAVALASVMTPVAVFGIVFGILDPGRRIAAWSVGFLALVAVVGSYARVSLLAILIAVFFTAAFLLVSGDRGRVRVVLAALIGASVLATIGVLIASTASNLAGERLQGFVDPAGDRSVNLRVDNWRYWLDSVPEHPLGQGLGRAGSAGGEADVVPVTTDNSFLKILVEQGLVGTPLFVLGLVLSVLAISLRLPARESLERSVGLAALTAFVAFVVLWVAGEYIEQPGKVLAWMLLGVAAGAAFFRESGARRSEPSP